MTRNHTKPRRVLGALGKVVLILLLLIVALVIYAERKMRWAKHQVDEFCKGVAIGQPVAGVQHKAKEMHLHYREIPAAGGKDGAFVVWEGFSFGRWFCDVEYKNGKVVVKKVSFLD